MIIACFYEDNDELFKLLLDLNA